MSAKEILLIACYELGHPPLSLAWPLAFLQRAGHAATAHDASLQPVPDEALRAARLIAFAAPMHTALRLALPIAQRARALNPSAHICFYGLYAWLNADYLLEELADSLIAGEYETPLCALADALIGGQGISNIEGVSTRTQRAAPQITRPTYPVPHRAELPALSHYARYLHGGHTQLAGYVEATRGCLHTCAHCPITPVYQGRFVAVPIEVVMSDLAQQVAHGAEHITFGDPDFLNGPTHALALTRILHQRYPRVTFDFTTKVEHILQHRNLLDEFAANGCTFVISAIESVSDGVLNKLRKGHTAAQIDVALALLDAAGLEMLPTLVAFTPWTTLADYLAQIEFIHTRRLTEHILPVQLSIRLLIPPHSAVLEDAGDWLGPLDPAALTYVWTHPDPRMDALSAQVAARVAEAEARGESATQTHHAIRELAYAIAHHPAPILPARPSRPAPPRLTENWFC